MTQTNRISRLAILTQCGTTSSSLVENLTICSIEVDQGIYDTDLNYL